jgi:predicted lipoprotein with Yx(FWY)xxD motif
VTHRHALGATAVTAIALFTAGCGSSTTNTTTAADASSTSAPTTSASGGSATTAASTTAASTTSHGVKVTSKHGKLGTFLAAGSKRLTVYLFEADKGGRSACSGACARVWPPVTTSGPPTAGSGARTADLGTITRSDGSKQVTYKGHPLYYYVRDKDDGDAYGQGSDSFGAEWYVLTPKGSKIDDDDGDHS